MLADMEMKTGPKGIGDSVSLIDLGIEKHSHRDGSEWLVLNFGYHWYPKLAGVRVANFASCQF